jgi:hypothetical protein
MAWWPPPPPQGIPPPPPGKPMAIPGNSAGKGPLRAQLADIQRKAEEEAANIKQKAEAESRALLRRTMGQIEHQINEQYGNTHGDMLFPPEPPGNHEREQQQLATFDPWRPLVDKAGTDQGRYGPKPPPHGNEPGRDQELHQEAQWAWQWKRGEYHKEFEWYGSDENQSGNEKHERSGSTSASHHQWEPRAAPSGWVDYNHQSEAPAVHQQHVQRRWEVAETRPQPSQLPAPQKGNGDEHGPPKPAHSALGSVDINPGTTLRGTDLTSWITQSLRGKDKRALDLPGETAKGATGEPPLIYEHSTGIRYMQLAGIAHSWGFATNDIRDLLTNDGNKKCFEIIDEVHGPIVLTLWDPIASTERNNYTTSVLGNFRSTKQERGKGHGSRDATHPYFQRQGGEGANAAGLPAAPSSTTEPCAEPHAGELAPARIQGDSRAGASQPNQGTKGSDWSKPWDHQAQDDPDYAEDPPVNASYNPWCYLTEWNQNDPSAWD